MGYFGRTLNKLKILTKENQHVLKRLTDKIDRKKDHSVGNTKLEDTSKKNPQRTGIKVLVCACVWESETHSGRLFQVYFGAVFIECRKLLTFALVLHYFALRLVEKTGTAFSANENQINLQVCVFQRLAPVPYNCFKLWLATEIASVWL